MSRGGAFLAIDWGTTNRRVYRIEKGAVTATTRDDRGVKAMAGAGYEAAIADDRAALGDLPVLIAGMAGSSIGWREAAYAPAPATIAALAAGLLPVEDRIAIVPGVAQREPHADVMRGEEVQLLGAAAAGMAPPDALLCQPGTHCKWVQMAGGAIAGFTTAMNGELFALLRQHSVLASSLAGPVSDGAAFRAGVAEGARRDLAASLFGVRARGLLGQLAAEDAASFASGVLIGADTAARLAGAPGAQVHILADPALGGLHAASVETLGGSAILLDSHAAFVAGITAIRELIQ